MLGKTLLSISAAPGAGGTRDSKGVDAAYLPLTSLFSGADEQKRSNRCSPRSWNEKTDLIKDTHQFRLAPDGANPAS